MKMKIDLVVKTLINLSLQLLSLLQKIHLLIVINRIKMIGFLYKKKQKKGSKLCFFFFLSKSHAL